jgi:hypothetical protein
MITTINDFIGQNNIPDKSTYGENLQWFINKFEPKLLEKLLGSDLYAAYLASPADARFVAIIEPYLHPALVDYIYWFYLEDQGIQLTSLGASQNKKQNAKSVSPYPKMVRAWNEMVELNRNLHKYLTDNAATYPEYVNTFPEWFFGWGFWSGTWQCWFFDWSNCGGEFGNCVDEIYRIKNTLGI